MSFDVGHDSLQPMGNIDHMMVDLVDEYTKLLTGCLKHAKLCMLALPYIYRKSANKVKCVTDTDNQMP